MNQNAKFAASWQRPRPPALNLPQFAERLRDSLPADAAAAAVVAALAVAALAVAAVALSAAAVAAAEEAAMLV